MLKWRLHCEASWCLPYYLTEMNVNDVACYLFINLFSMERGKIQHETVESKCQPNVLQGT